jgi:hypothetical protein
MPYKDEEKAREACRKSYRKHRKEKLIRNKIWHDKNVDKHRALVNKWCISRYRRNLEIVSKIKNVPCMDCNNSFPPECMDFDHREGTEKCFTIGSRTTLSLERLMTEIAKCDIVCSNCHRIRTRKRGAKCKKI